MVAPVADGAEGTAADGAAGKGREVAIPRGAALETCPLRALRAWLDVLGCRFGPVFRKVDRWGGLEHTRPGTDAVRRVLLRRRAEAARLGQEPKSARAPGSARGGATRRGEG